MQNLYLLKALLGGGMGQAVMACHVLADDANHARHIAVKLYQEGLATGEACGLAPMPKLHQVHIVAIKSQASRSQAVNG